MSEDNESWRTAHREAIDAMLRGINAEPDNPFILKGGTALMACYGLDRFSEDIDLDGQRANVHSNRFFSIIDQTCRMHGYSWRKAKDTSTVRRAFVDYGNPERPLKIEASFRRRQVPSQETAQVNGILVYTISRLCELKTGAYLNRDKIRDLYDLAFIADRYYDQLDESAKAHLQTAFEYKDLEQFDYLVRTQSDPLIDNAIMEDRFLKALDKLGIITADS
ncbi:nucleotidyl transferase AbiEii/AbiGii toxin family protein [Bifidobacterium tibiigranuli]|jgi:predicted nucleotidyltransferase component of viral defense system|uniref:nucleotidyl transferase AbiEii/AbiGii toxin family protein n=1 Tax=Bifidobacterium tibiigranuli TaxID=2172043 RepID=UPI002354AEA1|nr:nucleotidyl transferase AbiEii/AbiGii toxin family protein [Bifidobacterium tibiigranuli]MCI1211242.1 nucleotidyl transferase AbiEii/AbiGii toxin family protein [Bifidobacterium tibiigranuli]MCI1221345.1 nucleotidyl transferase AbiEii/AbiGii toxin family protein [Bifidobacterium tibiigranuli]MCI1232363.1 nucleotidyl transferase AbiEii/AbiGii toxin family protein [Bifidobacterium tibiigranuli]